MKYMTPLLIGRLQADDESLLAKATSDWEDACERYNRRIEEIRPQLATDIATLLDQYCLHDAEVLAGGVLGNADKNVFYLALRLDGTQDVGLALTYTLTTPPRWLRYKDLNPDEPTSRWVLYDELDVKKEGERLTFSHAILFSGGRELRLSFTELRVQPIRELITPFTRGGAGEEEVVANEAVQSEVA